MNFEADPRFVFTGTAYQRSEPSELERLLREHVRRCHEEMLTGRSAGCQTGTRPPQDPDRARRVAAVRALHARAGTPGEREAARAALERLGEVV